MNSSKKKKNFKSIANDTRIFIMSLRLLFFELR